MRTAGGVLSVDYGVPTIGFGPGEEDEAHAANESVRVANLADAVFGSAVFMHGVNRATTVTHQKVMTDMSEVSHGQSTNQKTVFPRLRTAERG